MPAETILRLARTIRWASVASLTRNARAICGVVRPTTARSVRASLASGRQRRVAAGEQQREPVVGAGRRLGRRVDARGQGPLPVAPAHRVHGVPVRRRVEPGGGALGRPVPAPRGQRLDDRGLDGLLGEVEVGVPPRQRGHQRAGLLAQGAREETVRAHGDRLTLTPRTGSSPRPSAGSPRQSRGCRGSARSWRARSPRPCPGRR